MRFVAFHPKEKLMTEQPAIPSTPPQPSQPDPEQMKEMVRNQLANVQKTKRIYQNIIQLIAQSTYRGEVAGAVSEAIGHAQVMANNLDAQERDLGVYLNPPPAPPVAKPKAVPKGPKLIQGGKKNKGKKR
jgi:hypothetical protein